MLELNGLELASFSSRALAMLIDFAIAGALFLAGLMLFFKIANRYTSLGQDNRHLTLELNFFENWYSIVYLVLFFGLSVYLGNGRTLGKRVMGIRVFRWCIIGCPCGTPSNGLLHSSEPPDGSRPHGRNLEIRDKRADWRAISRPVR